MRLFLSVCCSILFFSIGYKTLVYIFWQLIFFRASLFNYENKDSKNVIISIERISEKVIVAKKLNDRKEVCKLM